MVTALALQLIQCVVKLPQPKKDDGQTEEEQIEEAAKSKRDKHGRNKRKSDPVCVRLMLLLCIYLGKPAHQHISWNNDYKLQFLL